MILSFCATHKRATIPILESLNFEDKEQALNSLKSLDFVKECFLLQTCNRVEIYVVSTQKSTHKITKDIIKFWSQNAKVSRDVIFDIVEVFEGSKALRHLLLLASGLESMVVGEDQILGQIREAYLEAKNAGATNSFFDIVLMKAINTGRKVRTKTRINEGSVSLSSIAIDLAEKSFDNHDSTKALVIGAGKAGTLAAKELSKRKFETVYLANRTYQRSVELAKLVGGEPIKLREVNDYLSKVNLVITAVSVSEPLLTSANVMKALCSKSNPKLMFIDISQPRCVEDSVRSLKGVTLKSIDDLRETVETNLQKRLHETINAKKIVDEELLHLEDLLKKIGAEPVISSLCRKMEKIRCAEFTKAIHIINGLNDDQRLVIENLTKELVERILQSPIENLRKATLNGDKSVFIAVNNLFGLDNNA